MDEGPTRFSVFSHGILAQMLGCLGGALAFSLLILFLLASCTANPKADGSVIVEDQAGLFSPSTTKALQAVKFPEDRPVVVRTVDTIPPAKIGSFATDLMANDPNWQTLRPRGLLRRTFRHDLPSGPGIFVLVSRSPRIVQIRFGPEIRLLAYQEGLAVGPWYRAHQRYENDRLDEQIVGTVRELAERMRSADEQWGLLAWARSMSSVVVSEVEDFFAPSDGLYSNQILANYIRVAQRSGATSAAWRFVAFNLLCFVAFWLVGKKLLVGLLLLPRVTAGWLRIALAGITDLGLAGILVTGFAALAILSRGRIEDELALDALGLTFLSTTSFDPMLYATNGGFLIAIPGLLVALLADLAQAAMVMHEAHLAGEHRLPIPYTWLAWGCALYLLPLPVALPALAVLIWKTAATVATARSVLS